MPDSAIATACCLASSVLGPFMLAGRDRSSKVGIATLMQGSPSAAGSACAMGVLGSDELDMSRTCWDATVTKKMRSWRDVLAQRR